MRHGFGILLTVAVAVVCLIRPATAAPWMWDQDTDQLDDRLEDVALNGILYAYENLDPDGRLRFEVQLVSTLLQYGGYVRFNHLPTPADSLALSLLGAQVVSRFETVPYIRVRALYPTLLLIKLRSDVERIEAVSLLYPVNWREGHVLGVRKGYGPPFPTLEDGSNPTGQGVVVAILDSGINDTPQGSYPGHSDVAGKVVGGAWYGGSGPSGYTDWSQSVNPSQSALGFSTYHGTHIAGTIGGGSRDRTFGGVAPGAKLVDVKVLGDDGTGSGLAEGLEWCIHNRNRSWGGGASGIDILNLSLSSVDASDGQDCVSGLVNKATLLGMVVVASAGNSGSCGFFSAPAAADGAITVGACDPGTLPDPSDDTLAPFSNEGPRASDADGSLVDEMKPDLVAPGVNVISASGSPAESGYHYASASGTSMSTALVSGAVALLLEANPSLTPADVKRILHDTAVHRTGSPHGCSAGTDPFGLDARYHSGWGFGILDVYAAWQEAVNAGGTQFVRVAAEWNAATSQVDVAWTTQREVGLTGFHVQRAPDLGGVPGSFVNVTGAPVPAIGPATLTSLNRTTYTIPDAAPGGPVYWYRVMTVGGPIVLSPHKSVRAQAPAAIAVLDLTHNTPETDLTLKVGSGLNPALPVWVKSVSMLDCITALLPLVETPADDRTRYTFAVPLYPGEGAATHLPPSPEEPWFFTATEGGDASRTGTLEDFEITTTSQTYATDTPRPVLTTNGSPANLWIPQPSISGVPDGGPAKPALSASPNPFRAATRLKLRLDASEPVRLSIVDVQGREVTVLVNRVLPAGEHAWSWDGRDARGRSRPAGHYYLRLSRSSGNQVIPLVYID